MGNTFASGFASQKGGGATVAFPDVCKTPAPPAPFVPVPYPNTQFEKNLRKAAKIDGLVAAGDRKAVAVQKEVISNLKKSMGDEAGTMKGVVSATMAVKIGYTLHKGGVGKPLSGKVGAIEMVLANQPSFWKLK